MTGGDSNKEDGESTGGGRGGGEDMYSISILLRLPSVCLPNDLLPLLCMIIGTLDAKYE